jgi:hypothetical protein
MESGSKHERGDVERDKTGKKRRQQQSHDDAGGADQHRDAGADAVCKPSYVHREEQGNDRVERHQDADRELARALVECVQRHGDTTPAETGMAQRAHEYDQVNGHAAVALH